MNLKLVFYISLMICINSNGFSQSTNEEIYSKYLNCDLNYFWNNEINDPLFNGLKAVILREYDTAEELLLELIPTVSDSLKKSIYTDLVYINYSQRKWSKGNEYTLLADSNFDATKNPCNFFPQYPNEYIFMEQDSVSVDFIDGFHIQGRINASEIKENIILDTGCSPSVVSMSLAQRYNLKIDSTDHKATVSGFGIPTKTYSTIIEKLTIGDIEFFNIPTIVISDEMFQRIGLKGEIILGLTEMMMFDVIKFDYPQKKFTFIRQAQKKDSKPNFAILDFLPVINYEVRDKTISGIIDTGSPITYLFVSEQWDPQKEHKVRSIEKSWGEYKYTVNYYSFPISFSNCINGVYEILIMPNRNPPHRFKKESLLGNDIWSDKILMIDFKNNRVCFE